MHIDFRGTSLCLPHQLPWGSAVGKALANAGDVSSVPGSGRCPGEGNGNPLQCSCLGNPMNRGAWWASVHGDSPGKNTGVGCHALLQGDLPTQGLNPGLQHYRQILYQLSHQGSPRTLQWVAYPFSRGSSQPWDRTQVSCIAGGFFTI